MIRDFLLFLLRARVAWHWVSVDHYREELHYAAERAHHHRQRLAAAQQALTIAERGAHQPSVAQINGSRR